MGKEDERQELPQHWVPLGARASMSMPWERAFFAVSGTAVMITIWLAIWKDMYTWVWFAAVALSVLVIPAWIVSRAKARLDRSREEMLRAKGYLVCPECTYDLTGVPRTQPRTCCPECGTPFVADAMPEVWQRIQERWEESQRSGSG